MRTHWILLVVIAVCLVSTASAQVTLLHEFAGGSDDGRRPHGSLILSGGTLYGTTESGGDQDFGVIFRLNTDGTGHTLLHEFAGGPEDGRAPHGSLTLNSDSLYGMTTYGGGGDRGVVFQIETDGTGHTALLADFFCRDGRCVDWSRSLTLSGDTLYGMTPLGGGKDAGVVFRVNTDGSGYTHLHDFAGGTGDGRYPYGSLTVSGNMLYGTTRSGGNHGNGVVFKINTDGTGYTLLHEFSGGSDDGDRPYGSLTVSGDTLYGMTAYGGDDDYGVVFRMNTDGAGYTLLHEFTGGSDDGRYPRGSPTVSGDTLYGMTAGGGSDGCGTIFRMNTDGSGYTLLHEFSGGSDGGAPYGSLTLNGDTLYGMTRNGGYGYPGSGVVFRMNTDGTGYTILHEFGVYPDGGKPHGSLTLSGSTLYGMTGSSIFRMNTDGTGYALLHKFAGGPDDGREPYGSLTLSGNTLYGMTADGGDDNDGVVFRVNTDGAGYTHLHEFSGDKHYNGHPWGSLTLSGDTLYGMTYGFGDPLTGSTVFAMNTNGRGYYTRLHEFVGGADDGLGPHGSLTLSGNTLYGMTTYGGDDDYGVVFRMNTDGTGYTHLHEFGGGGDDGRYPYGSLTLSGDTLYGMTPYGGNYDRGVVFRMNTDGTDYTVLHEFAGGSGDGRHPFGSLTRSADSLYGMTFWGGDYDHGVVFQINTDGSGYTLLHEFSGGSDDGARPYGSLTLSGNILYGMTAYGGDYDRGAVFSIAISGPPHIEALKLFYNATFADAADPAKTFLAVGEASSMSVVGTDLFGNVTNYLNGITGIRVMFDQVVTYSGGVAAAFSYEATPEQSSDKTFSPFVPPTSPIYVVDDSTGKTVVTITFADGEIKNRWLKTIIDASQVVSAENGFNLDGELPSPLPLPSGDGTAGGNAEFIIGNRVGDVDGNYRCLLNDAVLVRNHVSGSPVGISNAYDMDKNGLVLLNDAILTRNAVSGTALPALP